MNGPLTDKQRHAVALMMAWMHCLPTTKAGKIDGSSKAALKATEDYISHSVCAPRAAILLYPHANHRPRARSSRRRD